jgi:hypothetical protein
LAIFLANVVGVRVLRSKVFSRFEWYLRNDACPKNPYIPQQTALGQLLAICGPLDRLTRLSSEALANRPEYIRNMNTSTAFICPCSIARLQRYICSDRLILGIN